MKTVEFKLGDIIIHKGGTKYIVLGDNAYLEANAAPAYSYLSIEGKPEVWQRVKTEMEDGRFQLYDPSPEEFKEALTIFENYKKQIKDAFYKFKSTCKHAIVNKYDSAVCQYCNQDFGWYCPDSKDHHCHYFSDDGKVMLSTGEVVVMPSGHNAKYETDDCCLFCGNPDERK